MSKDKKTETTESEEDKKKRKIKEEEEIDEELKQTFPASDPPSYSQPGNGKKYKSHDM